MARRGEEASAEQPRPESVWPRKILHRKAEIEIKNLQFARWRRYSHHVWPATWNLVEVAGEGQRRRSDDGQRAGFGGHDGEADGPPGGGAPAQEVILQALS